MQKISILVMSYNEVNNVEPMKNVLTEMMEKNKEFNYEIIFTDNASEDGTEEILRRMAKEDKKVKVLLNNRNYGAQRSYVNGLRYATGDCVITIPADFQEPPELIPRFIQGWKEGYKIVAGQKVDSQEGKIIYFLRTMYYKIISSLADIPQLEHVSGIMLYDKKALKYILDSDEDIFPRHLIAEMGFEVKLIQYKQQQRRSGKSSYNVGRYFSFAINSLIATSTAPLRVTTLVGCFTACISFVTGIAYLLYKILYWDTFQAGMTPILLGMLFLGSIQLISIGLIGEYVGVILKKVSKHPPVIEKEIINFDTKDL